MIILNPEDFGLSINQGIVGLGGKFVIRLVSDYSIQFKLSPENETGEFLGEIWECGSADKRAEVLESIKRLFLLKNKGLS